MKVIMGSAFARDRSTSRGPAYVGSRFRVTSKVEKTCEQSGKIYQDYVARVQDQNVKPVLLRELSSTFFSLEKVKTSALGDRK